VHWAGKAVTVYDVEPLSLVATLPMAGQPEFTVGQEYGHIDVNIEKAQGQLVMIDSMKLAISATWPPMGSARPAGFALDAAESHLYSVYDGKAMVVTNALTSAGCQVARGHAPGAQLGWIGEWIRRGRCGSEINGRRLSM
jgi:hypothetical protein